MNNDISLKTLLLNCGIILILLAMIFTAFAHAQTTTVYTTHTDLPLSHKKQLNQLSLNIPIIGIATIPKRDTIRLML
jgi:hypothetical protein